jgi:hypothetical protein
VENFPHPGAAQLRQVVDLLSFLSKCCANRARDASNSYNSRAKSPVDSARPAHAVAVVRGWLPALLEEVAGNHPLAWTVVPVTSSWQFPAASVKPRHPERIWWGHDRYCAADDLAGGNGTIRTPHPSELFGEDWLAWPEERARSGRPAAAIINPCTAMRSVNPLMNGRRSVSNGDSRAVSTSTRA